MTSRDGRRVHARPAARAGDRVEVRNLDGSVAYRGLVVHVDGAVKVRADGSRATIAEHPASIRLVVEPCWL